MSSNTEEPGQQEPLTVSEGLRSAIESSRTANIQFYLDCTDVISELYEVGRIAASKYMGAQIQREDFDGSAFIEVTMGYIDTPPFLTGEPDSEIDVKSDLVGLSEDEIMEGTSAQTVLDLIQKSSCDRIDYYLQREEIPKELGAWGKVVALHNWKIKVLANDDEKGEYEIRAHSRGAESESHPLQQLMGGM